MLDRVKQPDYKEIRNIEVIKPISTDLDNGMPMFCIKSGSQDFVKIEFIFDAGNWYEKNKLVATTTSAMLNEGTLNKNSNQIATLVDYFGAYLQFSNERDKSTATLITLNKHLNEVLPLLKEVLTSSIFPEKELDIYLQKQKNNYIVNSQKVKNLAYRGMSAALFGKDHPYGFDITTDDYDNVEKKQLIDHFNRLYIKGNYKIIITGNVNNGILDQINELFGNINTTNLEGAIVSLPENTEPKEHYIEKSDSVQNGIRIGKQLFNRTHNDYFGLKVLNTVLGGYFGSRLMTNIREDKGYTYGIGSAMVSMQHSGYFTIISEVGTEFCEKTIGEIKKELKILRSEQISEQELIRVKNYMLGDLLNKFDGPLSISASIRELIDFDLNENYYISYIDTIRSINTNELISLANKYLHEDSMHYIIAGKR